MDIHSIFLKRVLTIYKKSAKNKLKSVKRPEVFTMFAGMRLLGAFQADPTPHAIYKTRLMFHSLSHQSDQQFEQKYENKPEKSGSDVENSLEFMLSQCCVSSLTCSSPPSQAAGRRKGEEDGPVKISPKMSHGERTVTWRKRGKRRRRGARKFRKLTQQNTRGFVHLAKKTACTRPIGPIPRKVKSRSTHTRSPTAMDGSCRFHLDLWCRVGMYSVGSLFQMWLTSF